MAILQKYAVESNRTNSRENYILNSRIMELIEEYSELKDNWDENDALAPSASVIDSAKQLISLLEKKGQVMYHSAPGPNGEIMVDIRNQEKSIEIIFYKNRAVSVQIPKIGKPTQKNFEINDLQSLLIWLNKNEK